jgi:hypothetical protein
MISTKVDFASIDWFIIAQVRTISCWFSNLFLLKLSPILHSYSSLHFTATMDFSSGFGPKVSQCEAIIGYCFNSKVLCAEALNAAVDSKSVYILDGLLQRMPKNDRLAVYGDSAAAFYLCSIWVQRGLDKR